MIASFNTGIYVEGVLTLNRSNFMITYLKYYFIVDLCCVLSLILEFRLFSLVFLFQLSRISEIFYNLDMIFQIQEKIQIFSNLCINATPILVVTHYSACAFLYVTLIDKSDEQNWLEYNEIQDSHWLTKYTNAVYYMAITMSTIGYGDISPRTTFEQVFGMIIALMACGVFAYEINMIGIFFQDRANKQASYKIKRRVVLKYMKNRNISKQSQIKVLKYLEYQYNFMNQEENMEKGQQILSTISNNIREEVYKEFYPRILAQSKLISKYLSQQFIDQLALYMNEATFSSGEIVFQKGSYNDNLYFIIQGVLEIYDVSQDKNISVRNYINEGQFFGYKGFFLNKHQRSENIRSQNTSQILYIKREDLLKLLEQHPKEFEKYILLQDLLLNNNNSFRICQICETFEHDSQYCPIVHYSPDQDKIKKQVNFTYQQSQARQRYFRQNGFRDSLRFKPLKGKQFYREQAIEFRKQYVLENKYYHSLESIFLIIDQQDDEQIVSFTPQIKFYDDNVFYIQPLAEFQQQIEELGYDLDLNYQLHKYEQQKILFDKSPRKKNQNQKSKKSVDFIQHIENVENIDNSTINNFISKKDISNDQEYSSQLSHINSYSAEITSSDDQIQANNIKKEDQYQKSYFQKQYKTSVTNKILDKQTSSQLKRSSLNLMNNLVNNEIKHQELNKNQQIITESPRNQGLFQQFPQASQNIYNRSSLQQHIIDQQVKHIKLQQQLSQGDIQKQRISLKSNILSDENDKSRDYKSLQSIKSIKSITQKHNSKKQLTTDQQTDSHFQKDSQYPHTQNLQKLEENEIWDNENFIFINPFDFIPNFEVFKEFQFYKTNNNVSNVLKSFKKYQEKIKINNDEKYKTIQKHLEEKITSQKDFLPLLINIQKNQEKLQDSRQQLQEIKVQKLKKAQSVQGDQLLFKNNKKNKSLQINQQQQHNSEQQNDKK